MCFVALFVILIYIAVATFFVTARVLLPWTIAATITAVLISLAIGYFLPPKLGKKIVPLSMGTTLGLTLAVGYAFYLLNPPVPPPKQAANQDILKILFTLPVPDIDQADLWNTLPLHLGISGALGAVIVASWLSAVLSKKEKEKEAGESPFEDQIKE